MKNIVIIGAGFAGLWAAISATRARELLQLQAKIQITLINKTPYHDIRVCNYKADIDSTRLAIEDILSPIDIDFLIGTATHIDTTKQCALVSTKDTEKSLNYDQLILASGSQLTPLAISGFQKYSFNIDSYGGAKQLQNHLTTLDHSQPQTVVVVGSGFTGLELATELVDRLPQSTKIILIDRSDIASSLGEQPQEKILDCLEKLHIGCLAQQEVAQVNADALILASGKTIPTQTVICTTSLSASPLTKLFKTKKSTQGRLAVDEHLQITGHKHCFAAGDVAHAQVDTEHFSLMSCQHAIPQGKIAGFNAVAVLAGKPMMSYQQAVYVTCLDLGPAGALFMRGWEREIEKQGNDAKALKQWINTERIRPVITSDADAFLAQGNPAPMAKVR